MTLYYSLLSVFISRKLVAPTFSPLGPRFPLSPSGPLLPCKKQKTVKVGSANNALQLIFISISIMSTYRHPRKTHRTLMAWYTLEVRGCFTMTTINE